MQPTRRRQNIIFSRIINRFVNFCQRIFNIFLNGVSNFLQNIWRFLRGQNQVLNNEITENQLQAENQSSYTIPAEKRGETIPQSDITRKIQERKQIHYLNGIKQPESLYPVDTCYKEINKDKSFNDNIDNFRSIIWTLYNIYCNKPDFAKEFTKFLQDNGCNINDFVAILKQEKNIKFAEEKKFVSNLTDFLYAEMPKEIQDKMKQQTYLNIHLPEAMFTHETRQTKEHNKQEKISNIDTDNTLEELQSLYDNFIFCPITHQKKNEKIKTNIQNIINIKETDINFKTKWDDLLQKYNINLANKLSRVHMVIIMNFLITNIQTTQLNSFSANEINIKRNRVFNRNLFDDLIKQDNEAIIKARENKSNVNLKDIKIIFYKYLNHKKTEKIRLLVLENNQIYKSKLNMILNGNYNVLTGLYLKNGGPIEITKLLSFLYEKRIFTEGYNNFLNEQDFNQLKTISTKNNINLVLADHYKTDDNFYVTLQDYIKGQTLHDFIKTNKNDPKKIYNVINKFLFEFDKLIQNQYVHADLNPGNIIIQNNNNNININIIDTEEVMKTNNVN